MMAPQSLNSPLTKENLSGLRELKFHKKGVVILRFS